MSGLLLKPILLLTLAFTAFSLAARVLGSTQLPNPALEGFTVGCEDKPQPCWYGIVPGVTTVEKAKKILMELKPNTSITNNSSVISFNEDKRLASTSCSDVRLWLADNNSIIELIDLSRCGELRLGEVMAVFGRPLTIGQQVAIYINFMNYKSVIIDYSFTCRFLDNDLTKKWSPETKVIVLVLATPIRNINETLSLTPAPWMGFVPSWRYCQKAYIG